MTRVLIVMAGLPGSGKSAVAEELARVLGCAVISVDPIEAALRQAGIDREQPTGLAAYVVAETVAREQLRLGHRVVVDAVNDADEARQQWRGLAAEFDGEPAFVEVFCSDEAEHRRRLEGRCRDLPDFPEPTWASVVARAAALEQWRDDRTRVDSMQPVSTCVDLALRGLGLARS